MQTNRQPPAFSSIAFLAMLLATSDTLAASPAAPDTPATTASVAIVVPASELIDGAFIGDVNILNGSIFDLQDPAEDKTLYRLANRAHMTTRPHIIRQQLLFHPGDRLSKQTIEESERILRENRYLQTVSIEPVQRADGVVDVNVKTSDTWTLMPKISLSRSGGKNKSALGIKETNLLGSGVAVEALYRSDVDREYRTLKVTDRNLGSSWYGLTGIFENNSDGYTRSLSIIRPFYSLQSTHALGFSGLNNDQTDFYYDRGEEIGQYRHETRQYEIFGGWSKGLQNGWARRYTTGIAIDQHRFSPVPGSPGANIPLPADRQFAYPFIGFELVQDRFLKSSNYDQINRTEDVFLGTRLAARLGLAVSDPNSNGNTWLLNASAQTGFGDVDNTALLLSGSVDTRIASDGLQNLLLSAFASYYRRQSEHRLLYASLGISYGENLDLDQFLGLGGDTGLRGYPLRYQTGDKRALLTLEQRYFTDWYPWRLFRIGGAVFFDIGRAWGDSPAGRADDRLLKNLGAGLRIGNSRSGLGRMTHIDVAMPLDGGSDVKNLQFLVSTKKSF